VLWIERNQTKLKAQQIISRHHQGSTHNPSAPDPQDREPEGEAKATTDTFLSTMHVNYHHLAIRCGHFIKTPC